MPSLLAHRMSAVITRANSAATILPKPFLRRPIVGSVYCGWDYPPAEKLRNGVDNHEAIDFLAPRHTEVVAAADGWAMASWQEYPRRVGGHRRDLNGAVPEWFGAGLFVQILHDNGWYTQYCHLHRVSHDIPYAEPLCSGEGNDVAWTPSPLLRQAAKLHRDRCKTIRVRAGETIGTVGMTGCGVGKPTHPDWKADMPYRASDKPHLHFVVFGPRAPKTRESKRVDPFGIYGLTPLYPSERDDWSELPRSLWLPSS